MAVRFGRNSSVCVDAPDGPSRAADVQDPLDILDWMEMPLELEDGITLFEIMRCLRPWAEIVTRLAKVDFISWHDCSSLAHLSGQSRDACRDLVAIELVPSLIVDRSRIEKSAEIRTRWVSHGIAGGSRGRSGRQPLCRNPWEYAALPVTVSTKAEVRDRMTGGNRPQWDLDPVLRPTLDGAVDCFMAVPTVLDALLGGLFDDLAAAADPEDQAVSLAFVFGKLRALSG